MDAQPAIPTCYRHPDRQTRLSCGSCTRATCIECVLPTAMGQRCAECAAAAAERQPASSGPDLHSLEQRGTPLTYALLGVSVAVFVLGLTVPALQQPVLVGGVVTSRLFGLFAQINPLVAAGEIYRLFTAAFLHADFAHLLFNMWALFVFGPQLERRAGSLPFLLLYLASALTGGVAYLLFGGGNVAVGASGAIFGLFGAWLAAFAAARHTSVGRAGLRQLLVLLAINLALPLVIPQIAWQAHLGGLLAGGLIAVTWGSTYGRTNGVPLRAGIAAVVLVAVLALVAV